MSLIKIKTPHIIGTGISPKESDVVIASIDSSGSPGRLNQYVISELGYTQLKFPTANQLMPHGFFGYTEINKPSLLLVVTVDGNNTLGNLSTYLYDTLTEFRGWFRNKKLWIPLMGTGDGGLTLEDSYTIIVSVFNKFQETYPTDCTVIISLPETEDGNWLLDRINNGDQGSEDDLEKTIKNFKSKFFLLGSYWGSGSDQTNRFVEKGVWENGYRDGTYYDLVVSIKPNDVLLLKSTYAKDGVSYLKIKAVGIALANPSDGINITADWILINLNIEIAHLGSYRNTIHEADWEDVWNIFNRIPADQRDLVFKRYGLTQSSARETLPGLVSDSDKGIDYLDIGKDVNAFARVIGARSFEPPLAIALFGRWGSGKSFFMRELKSEIDSLGQNSGKDGSYCSGVVHIHFNAWSYIDANLWASLVTRIFEGLQFYITHDNLAKKHVKEIEETLVKNLNIAQEEIQQLKFKSDSLHKQIAHFKSQKSQLSVQLDKKIRRIQNQTLSSVLQSLNERFKVSDRIKESIRSNKGLAQTENEIRRIVPEKYWDNPELAYNQARSFSSYIVDFVHGRSFAVNIIWLMAFAAIAWFGNDAINILGRALGQVDFSISSQFWFGLSSIGFVASRILSTYQRLRPTINALWTIKSDYETQKAIVVSEYEQKEKALRLEIDKTREQIAVISGQISQTENLRSGYAYKINNALSTQALYNFIEKRCNSEDYQKHLGIVSMIRKDFEILTELFNNHNGEYFNAEDKEKFKSYFENHLERIVLYIDDLDRCPEDLVVQVIEAVNLLMAFPLFVVVVGVDPVWIRKALIKKHSVQFNNVETAATGSMPLTNPAQYLEKIFQVPFRLKDAEDGAVREMIKQLARVNKLPADSTTPFKELKADAATSGARTDVQDKTSLPKVIKARESGLIRKQTAADLVITDAEVQFMQDVSVIIGKNPRAVKRFVNIFRIIKAHADFNYQGSEVYSLSAVLLLLALPLGTYCGVLPALRSYLDGDFNKGKNFGDFLSTKTSFEHEAYTVRMQLNKALEDSPSDKVLRATPVSELKKYYGFISRFSFESNLN